jgi:hypothetical protein
MLISVLNQSTLVSDTDISTMCAAIQIQLDLHFKPAWNIKEVTVRFYSNKDHVPGYAWTIYVVDDDTAVSGALGYHQETSDDKINGYVMCKPILSNGGTILKFDSNNPGQYAVSGTLSHEVLEAVLDPYTNKYSDNGSTSFCVEMCDPVEQIGYGIAVHGESVAVSDFVFPSYFNPQATLAANAPFNYLNTLKAPFTLLPGGYVIQRTGGPGTEKQVFGEEMPEWRKETKMMGFSRAGRRVAAKK